MPEHVRLVHLRVIMLKSMWLQNCNKVLVHFPLCFSLFAEDHDISTLCKERRKVDSLLCWAPYQRPVDYGATFCDLSLYIAVHSSALKTLSESLSAWSSAWCDCQNHTHHETDPVCVGALSEQQITHALTKPPSISLQHGQPKDITTRAHIRCVHDSPNGATLLLSLSDAAVIANIKTTAT